MTQAKPTDSEQVKEWAKSIGLFRHKETDDYYEYWSNKEIYRIDYEQLAFFYRTIQERDQQRLSAALEALPKKQDEHPIDPETGKAVEVYGYEATFNQAINQCKAALTAALGPDNSSVEEKHDVPQ